MFFLLTALAIVAVVAGIWAALNWRENARAAKGLPRHSGIRLVVAAAALLLLVFSGGCSLLFVPAAVRGDQYVDPMAVLVLGGIPFAVGVLLFWLSMRRNTG